MDDAALRLHEWVAVIWNGRQIERLLEFVDPAFVFEPAHAPTCTLPGQQAVKQFFHNTATAFPDFHLDLFAIEVEDDIVTACVRLEGTHLGPLYGIAPTGRRVKMVYLVGYQLRESRFIHGWSAWNYQDLAQQLRLTEAEIVAMKQARRVAYSLAGTEHTSATFAELHAGELQSRMLGE